MVPRESSRRSTKSVASVRSKSRGGSRRSKSPAPHTRSQHDGVHAHVADGGADSSSRGLSPKLAAPAGDDAQTEGDADESSTVARRTSNGTSTVRSTWDRHRAWPAVYLQLENSTAGKEIVGSKNAMFEMAPTYMERVADVISSKNSALLKRHIGEVERVSRDLRITELEIQERAAASIWGIPTDSSLFPKAKTLNCQLKEAMSQVDRLTAACEALRHEVDMWRGRALERGKRRNGFESRAHIVLRRNRLLQAASQHLGPEYDDVAVLSRVAQNPWMGCGAKRTSQPDSEGPSPAPEHDDKSAEETDVLDLKFPGQLQKLMVQLGHAQPDTMQRPNTSPAKPASASRNNVAGQSHTKKIRPFLPAVSHYMDRPERPETKEKKVTVCVTGVPQAPHSARPVGSDNDVCSANAAATAPVSARESPSQTQQALPASQASVAPNVERRLIQWYEEAIAELEADLKDIRQQKNHLRGPCASALVRKGDYEDFFLRCMNDANTELRRQSMLQDAADAATAPASARGAQCYNRAAAAVPKARGLSDSQRVLQLLLSNKDLLVKLYEKLFRRGRHAKNQRAGGDCFRDGILAQEGSPRRRLDDGIGDKESEDVLDWYLAQPSPSPSVYAEQTSR